MGWGKQHPSPTGAPLASVVEWASEADAAAGKEGCMWNRFGAQVVTIGSQPQSNCMQHCTMEVKTDLGLHQVAQQGLDLTLKHMSDILPAFNT